MENKPTITYSISEVSDEKLFLSLSTRLSETLSNLKVEWKRTYGRMSHELDLNLKIQPLTNDLLERNDLVTRPYFHIFWTDCSDVDQYRSSVRNEIASWINLLTRHKSSGWMIVVVMSDVLSRLTKAKLQLPRTSIADKVKAEFCPKNPERLQILFDPTRESTKSTESWSSLGSKVATTTVRCMEAIVSKYEDKVRSERERRNEKTWDFCNYFILQEELAFMYEMLGMCASALVQYDELDAMFTQYVLNANAGDVAHWLSKFSEPITRWHSLLLWKRVDSEARQAILKGHASLIDIRNYLFTRLCHLLFKMGKVREVTQRIHFFLHTIVTEVHILEINIPPGALECWVFMCCLELVDALKIRGKNSETSDMKYEQLLLENAGLWNLARLKLYSLGKLCGLLPAVTTTSQHLQLVVDLIGGMGESEEREDGHTSPSLLLREAMSSKNNFQRQYFELSELAMGTYKHMKRYRAARNIGSDLAEFYLLLGEPAQAEGYLLETVRMFKSDGWSTLCADANKRLANCYKLMMNIKKYLKLCYALMCDTALLENEKQFYCDEYRSLSTDLGDQTLSINLWPLATVTSIQFIPASTRFKIQANQAIEIEIVSHAPKAILFQKLEISLEYTKPKADDNISVSSSMSKVSYDGETDGANYLGVSSKKTFDSASAPVSPEPRRSRHRRHPSSSSSRDLMTQQIGVIDDSGKIELVKLNLSDPPNHHSSYVSLHDQSETNKDGVITWSGVTCRRSHDLLRRQDSSHSQLGRLTAVTAVAMESHDFMLELRQLTLTPGVNKFKLKLKTDLAGTFKLMQLRLNLHKTYFVLPHFYPIINYNVTNSKPTVALEQETSLICGVVQRFTIVVAMGDYDIIKDDCPPKLAVKAPSCVQFLKIVSCVVETKENKEQVFPCPLLSYEEERTFFPLPVASAHSTVTYCVACLCEITPIVFTSATRKRHRRTHSAPPATIPSSPKSAPRHQTIPEHPSPPSHHPKYNTTNEINPLNGGPETNSNQDNSVESEHATHTSDKMSQQNGDLASIITEIDNETKDSEKASSKSRLKLKSPFSKSKTSETETLQTEIENCVTMTSSIRIDDDLIEVTLDDDGSTPSGEFVDLPCIMDNRPGTPYESIESDFSESSTEIDPVTKPPLPNKKLIRHMPSKSDTGIKPLQNIQKREMESYITTHFIEISFPWAEVTSSLSTLRFTRSLEFTHAWNYYGADNRLLVVTVDNVTSQTIRLRNPSLLLLNSSRVETTQLFSSKEKTIKAGSNMVCAWKVNGSTHFSSIINAQFVVDVVSSCDVTDDVMSPGDDVIVSKATYKFELDNIQPIYYVTCITGDGESPLRSGDMTSLRIDVRRVRLDPGHETTKNGQQLLMFQVVDNRGRWAVCGKSSGVISLPLPNAIQSDNGVIAVGSATLEVMALIAGNLHLPFVILNRYMKRHSSELDERLGSTDSPVLKPPRLKPFEQGEVFYADQSRQVRVFPHDYVIEEPCVTEL